MSKGVFGNLMVSEFIDFTSPQEFIIGSHELVHLLGGFPQDSVHDAACNGRE